MIPNDLFNRRDIYIDYPYERVMFRWDHVNKQVFRRFYGKAEGSDKVPTDNGLFNDAVQFGDEISRERYEDIHAR